MAKKFKQRLPAAASVKAQPKKPNPFELKKTRTKFEVVGRKIKGSTKNVVQARQDAVNRVREGDSCSAWCRAGSALLDQRPAMAGQVPPQGAQVPAWCWRLHEHAARALCTCLASSVRSSRE